MSKDNAVRSDILAAGAERASRVGHALRLSEVITAAGAPRGSTYYYFPGGKDQLVHEVMNERARSLGEALARVTFKSTGAGDLLRRLVEHHRQETLGVAHSFHCPLAGVVRSGAPPDVVEGAGRAFAWLTAQLAASLRWHGMDEEEAQSAATSAIALMAGATSMACALRSEMPFDALATSITLLVHTDKQQPLGATASGRSRRSWRFQPGPRDLGAT